MHNGDQTQAYLLALLWNTAKRLRGSYLVEKIAESHFRCVEQRLPPSLMPPWVISSSGELETFCLVINVAKIFNDIGEDGKSSIDQLIAKY